MDDIITEVKKFYDDRIKSPFFISVLSVWLFTNRVLVFGIFNFGEEVSVGARIDWAATQIHKFNMWGIFTGLYGSIFYSLIVGTIAMGIYVAVKNSMRALYKWIDLKTIKLVYLVKPNDFVHISQRDAATARNKVLENEWHETKTKLIDAKTENDTLKEDYSKLKQSESSLQDDSNKYYKILRAYIEVSQVKKADLSALSGFKQASDIFKGKWVLGSFFDRDKYSEFEFEIETPGYRVNVPNGKPMDFYKIDLTNEGINIIATEFDRGSSVQILFRLKYINPHLFVGMWKNTVCVLYSKGTPWGFSLQ